MWAGTNALEMLGLTRLCSHCACTPIDSSISQKIVRYPGENTLMPMKSANRAWNLGIHNFQLISRCQQEECKNVIERFSINVALLMRKNATWLQGSRTLCWYNAKDGWFWNPRSESWQGIRIWQWDNVSLMFFMAKSWDLPDEPLIWTKCLRLPFINLNQLTTKSLIGPWASNWFRRQRNLWLIMSCLVM
jgi:hypothetical protein